MCKQELVTRKWIRTFIVMFMCVICVVCCNSRLVFAEETDDGFEYSVLDDGTVAITGYKGDVAELVIPGEINGKAVTIIGECAFEDCSGLISIEIPKSVTSIGKSAFCGCSGLTSIEIPESVTSIGVSAFSDCSGLTSIEIPKSVKNVGDCAFSGCSNLAYIIILGNVESIGESAFFGCPETMIVYADENSAVAKVAIEAGFTVKPLSELTTVGSKVTLTTGQYKVTKSNNKNKEVTYVAPKSSKKKSVTVPATVTIDGDKYKVTAISDKAFKGNKKLSSITIGKNVKKIGKEAFCNCKNLKTITIKSTVLKTVGKNAVKGINKKAVIKVPKKQYKKYKKLFKSNTGYKKTMVIKKN